MKLLSLSKLSLSLFTIFVFSNCAKQQLSAESIVQHSIEKHGSLKHWNALKTLSFDKHVSLFSEDGTLESTLKKHQEFTFQPSLKGQITWQNDTKKTNIFYKKGRVIKWVNDSLVTNKTVLEKAKNSFHAALYVISQPFNFLNKNTVLTYLGIVTLGNKKVHEVKVAYKEDTAVSNKWFYYFDVKNFKMVANKVILKDHTSFIENTTFDTTTRFTFNQSRKSYRLNDVGEKTYLRATYFYDNFKTEFQ